MLDKWTACGIDQDSEHPSKYYAVIVHLCRMSDLMHWLSTQDFPSDDMIRKGDYPDEWDESHEYMRHDHQAM